MQSPPAATIAQCPTKETGYSTQIPDFVKCQFAMKEEKSSLSRPDPIHRGEARSSPYPTSRLAPAFGLVELAAELEQADRMINGRTNAQLEVIAEQIRQLQAQARRLLEKAREDMQLHQARCGFRKIPGKIYHLYRDASGQLQFSMLSPEDWGGQPPQEYLGSYRLEPDMGWTAVEQQD